MPSLLPEKELLSEYPLVLYHMAANESSILVSDRL